MSRERLHCKNDRHARNKIFAPRASPITEHGCPALFFLITTCCARIVSVASMLPSRFSGSLSRFEIYFSVTQPEKAGREAQEQPKNKKQNTM